MRICVLATVGLLVGTALLHSQMGADTMPAAAVQRFVNGIIAACMAQRMRQACRESQSQCSAIALAVVRRCSPLPDLLRTRAEWP